MSIISNYENLNPNYHPNNMIEYQCRTREEFQHKLPFKDYDIRGDLIGYSWNYGDTLELTFNVNPIILVEKDAIIYTEENEAPTNETVGRLNQMAYNTYDFKCWRCRTLDQTTYVWELLPSFTFPKGLKDGKEIRLQLYKDIEDYKGTLTILNFRWEAVTSFDIIGDNTVTVEITPEISKKLVKGFYYAEIELTDEKSVIKNYTKPLIVK